MSFHFPHRDNGRDGGGKEKGGSQYRQCDAKTHDIASQINGRARGSGSLDRQGRDLAVEPILLFSKRHPCLGHAYVALEGRLTVSTLRKLQAIFRVFPKYVRLLHALDMGTERRIATENYLIVMGTILDVSVGGAAARSLAAAAAAKKKPGRATQPGVSHVQPDSRQEQVG